MQIVKITLKQKPNVTVVQLVKARTRYAYYGWETPTKKQYAHQIKARAIDNGCKVRK